MLSICMKHEYCKHGHLFRMLMWLDMTHSNDIRVFWRVLFCYTQQRKGLLGNVGKVHNQSSSHSLFYSLHTGSLAVVANVSVILIYRDRFHNFCFKLCNVFTWMFDNKCMDWICEQLVCTHIFFAKHLHWNASWILCSTLITDTMNVTMCSFKPDSSESKCLQYFFSKTTFCSSLFWHDHYTL